MALIKKSESFKSYESYKSYKIFIIIGLFILTVFAVLFALSSGSSDLTMWDVFLTLIVKGAEQAEMIIFNIRLSRVVMAVLCGIGLAITGCIM